MNNLQMARQGTSYTEGDIALAWGMGAGAIREVVSVAPEARVGRLSTRIDTGYIVETDRPVTGAPTTTTLDQFVRLSAPADDGDGLVFNAETGLFDPSPKAANISMIELPENATPEDIATAFNDLRVVLIEADLMEPDPT